MPGLATSALALFALTYGLIESNNYGWGSTRIIGALVVAAVALGIFIALELRQRLPMLDLSLFKNRTFAGANTVMLLVALAMFGVFFYISLYMQQVLGYSPVQAGAAFLPMTVLIILIAPQAGRVVDKVGARGLVAAGMLLLATSLFLFSRMGIHADFWTLLPAMLLGGSGMAITMTPTTAAAMGSVQRDKAGVGSAVLNSMRQVGGSLGIAVMGTIISSGRSGEGPSEAAFPASSPHDRGKPVHECAALGARGRAALIALAGSLVAVLTVRKVVHHPDPAATPAAFAEA